MTVGIDEFASLSGFTIRELLLEAASVASEEDDPAVKAAAAEMRNIFSSFLIPLPKPLTAGQVEAFTKVIDLALEYRLAVTTEEPDGFTPEDERRPYAVTVHHEDLKFAVHYLGTYGLYGKEGTK